MSIQRLFTLIFGVVIGCTALISLLIVLLINNQQQLSQSQDNRYRSYLLADELRQSSDDLTRMARTLAVTGDAAYEKHYLQILAIRNGTQPRPQDYQRPHLDFLVGGQSSRPAEGERVSLVELMRRQGFTNDELAKLAEAEANSNALVELETRAIEAALGRKSLEAGSETPSQLLHSAIYHQEKAKIMRPVDEFFAMLEKRTHGEVDALTAKGERYMTIIALLVALLIVIAVLGIVAIRRRVGAALSNLSSEAGKVASGQLNTDFNATRSGEFGELSTAFQNMVKSLRDIVGNVSQSSEHLQSSALHLRKAIQDTQSNIQQQELHTAEVATAMTEMAATVQEVARHAAEAASTATDADRAASDGHQLVNQMISTSEQLSLEIQEAAQVVQTLVAETSNIGSILDAIRGIADQTNLLALNAAIEAARAGEQGRGFAVVADEVRSLAQRTQSATMEIQSMLERLELGAGKAVQVMDKSREQAQATTHKAGEAGDVLEQINQSNQLISQMVIQIASAAEQQAAVAHDISERVDRVRELATNNTSNTTDVAHSTDKLAQLAEGLGGQIRHFVLR